MKLSKEQAIKVIEDVFLESFKTCEKTEACCKLFAESVVMVVYGNAPIISTEGLRLLRQHAESVGLGIKEVQWRDELRKLLEEYWEDPVERMRQTLIRKTHKSLAESLMKIYKRSMCNDSGQYDPEGSLGLRSKWDYYYSVLGILEELHESEKRKK